ncbi:MAG TPA: PIN domain-containing protein [Sphingobacteriaceae bacterium]
MTDTSGKIDLVVGDSDALIALTFEEDAWHEQAVATLAVLAQNDIRIVFPTTTIIETVTTFQRKFSNPLLAEAVISKVQEGSYLIADVERDILEAAFQLFSARGSKQNTLFDAVVAAVAQDQGIDYLFAFDGWYEKLGYTLAYQMY